MRLSALSTAAAERAGVLCCVLFMAMSAQALAQNSATDNPGPTAAQAAVAAQEKPAAAAEEKPPAADDKPAIVEQKPAPAEEKAAIAQDKPAAVEEKSAATDDKPAIVEQKPAPRRRNQPSRRTSPQRSRRSRLPWTTSPPSPRRSRPHQRRNQPSRRTSPQPSRSRLPWTPNLPSSSRSRPSRPRSQRSSSRSWLLPGKKQRLRSRSLPCSRILSPGNQQALSPAKRESSVNRCKRPSRCNRPAQPRSRASGPWPCSAPSSAPTIRRPRLTGATTARRILADRPRARRRISESVIRRSLATGRWVTQR